MAPSARGEATAGLVPVGPWLTARCATKTHFRSAGAGSVVTSADACIIQGRASGCLTAPLAGQV